MTLWFLLIGLPLIMVFFNTPFWEAKWLEGMILKDDFSGLFEVSCLKGCRWRLWVVGWMVSEDGGT